MPKAESRKPTAGGNSHSFPPIAGVVLACPICLDSSANILADGARAGALALGLVAAVVLAGFVRFAWRLISAEARDD